MDKLELVKRKIINPEDLSQVLAKYRFTNQKIVFTNGCFDVVHFGHISYLAQAANLGSKLIIGLNSDKSVKKLKGQNRPINGQMERAFLLASLSFVDGVIIFDQDTPFNLISNIIPDVLVKGGDYKIEDIVGYDIVKAHGGQIKTIKFVDGFSSTNIIEKSRL